MCDTVVALPSITVDKKVYFAKNSDRDPNEAQYIELIPGHKHLTGDTVHCTHIDIPQVKQTYTVLLSKPFWIWGAEMGVNEHGVAIGNEAVFTKIKPSKKPGLIGMDLLRLALERSKSSEEALQILISLIEEYGQSGNCSYDHELYYHNSYLIADRKESWVLETAGEQWAAIRVKDFYTISNSLTIESRWDLASKDLVKYAIDRKWCKSANQFSFRNSYSDLLFTHFSQAKKRRNDTFTFLAQNKDRINVLTLFSLLRSHNLNGKDWRPDASFTEWTVCVHKGFGPFRASQTTGSMVSRLSDEGDTHFLTGTAAPCTGIFKPFWLDIELPKNLKYIPDNVYNKKSIWWRHELLHREILKDYDFRLSKICGERDEIEENFVNQSISKNPNYNKRKQICKNSIKLAEGLSERWLKKVRELKVRKQMNYFHSLEWKSHNKKANIEDDTQSF